MTRWSHQLVPHSLFCLVTCMVLFGLVMVYSSSAFTDYRGSRNDWKRAVDESVGQATGVASNSSSRFVPGVASVPTLEGLRAREASRRASMFSSFLKQCCWAFVGFIALAFAAMVDYPRWGKRIGWVMFLVLAFQIALFAIPANTGLPIQSKIINGARSWLQIFSLRIQPSEMAKVGLIIFTAWYLARNLAKEKIHLYQYLPGLLVIAFSIGLILVESDKGVAVHLCLALLVLWMFAVGRFSHVVVLGGLAGSVIGLVIWLSPNAMIRIRGLFGENSYHMKQSFDALTGGGMFGIGLGDSNASLAHLPAAHTDFILAVIGEELGFIFTAALVAGYLAITLLGFKIAAGSGDPFGTLLALGFTTLIASQAFLNMAVVTGLVPTTGFTLPLVSYGGSSLTWTMVGIGILINISLSAHNNLLGDWNRDKVAPFGKGRELA